MKLELYQEVVLTRDEPKANLRRNDVATLIDYVPPHAEFLLLGQSSPARNQIAVNGSWFLATAKLPLPSP